VTAEELFTRSCFLAKLLEKEEVQRFRITEKTRDFFESLIKVMLDRKILLL
jgi:nucleoside diphosphate kinase